MLARHFQSGEGEAIDRLLGHRSDGDIRLDRDRMVVVGRPPTGLLVWRPGGIVHELHTGHGLAARPAANALVNFAIASAVARRYHLWEAVFVTDCDKVAEYVKGLGAVEELGKRVFTLGVRQ